jgi:EAL domain-containing protein (putative c-di-GMP-specific phosphodiesterase class I)
MFTFYQESMQNAADERLMMEKNIRKAIKNNELKVYYQPQFAHSGEIVGAEALLRWEHPEKGIISAADFIPVAEETGLIVEISVWMLQQACQQIKTMDENEIKVPQIAINISPKQFHQPDFVNIISRIVRDAGLKHNRIVLEIPEGIFLKYIDESVEKINMLKQRGFKLSIDDFGTGFSSLTYLKKLPFDQIKIDKSFVLDFLHNTNDAAIVKAIIMMARGLGLDMVAEGVETEKHLEVLSSYGCYYYQGYYFSKPLPADEFEEFLFNHCTALIMP